MVLRAEHHDKGQAAENRIINNRFESSINVLDAASATVSSCGTEVLRQGSFEIVQGLDPLLLELLELSINLFVLLKRNLHDWTHRQQLLQLGVKVSRDALRERDCPIYAVLDVVVQCAHFTQSTKDLLYRRGHLREVDRVQQVIDLDVLQNRVVVASLLVLRRDLCVVAEGKDDASVHS